jgi:hypothetical protein
MENEEKKTQEETEEVLKTDRDDSLGYTHEQIDVEPQKPAAKKSRLKSKETKAAKK